MLRFQSILHPTDFSDRAEPALQLARALASAQGARLVLLHVIPEEVPMGGATFTPLDPRTYRECLDKVRQRVDGADLKFPDEAHLREGNAAEEILRAANDLGCDVIVLGTHGRSGLGRLLLGSV